MAPRTKVRVPVANYCLGPFLFLRVDEERRDYLTHVHETASFSVLPRLVWRLRIEAPCRSFDGCLASSHGKNEPECDHDSWPRDERQGRGRQFCRTLCCAELSSRL